jgi:hypothetical protein
MDDLDALSGPAGCADLGSMHTHEALMEGGTKFVTENTATPLVEPAGAV